MTLEQWLEDARMDALRRKLPELADLLETLARSTAALRAADWNDDASGRRVTGTAPAESREWSQR